MEWLVTNAVAALLMPLGIVLILLLTALLMAWRWPLMAWRPIAIACALLYALSTQFVANGLLYVLEPAARDPAGDDAPAAHLRPKRHRFPALVPRNGLAHPRSACGAARTVSRQRRLSLTAVHRAPQRASP